ncbi:SMP-30/gluconolactonase/LRE family protein [Qaidamihabitans albus]|uniref:SMP-30/gluconolactonase/LRE family protein n=1 Tax=Qaidamihabitans albus TaxID=2795733 RepID=UPI0018F1FFA5|nr:SMP-30/gluconolactonase/LRE family protein [Qaidamihabitans albus]
MGDAVVERVNAPVAEHGEGPVWFARRGSLAWVDMLRGDVLTLDADGATGRWHVGTVAAALRPRTRGGAVLALERGFALADELGGPVRDMDPLWTDETVRMNDGGCDPDGRFYCGSMAYEKRTGAGALYRLDPSGSAERVLSGVTVSNGFAFSPDGGTAYYVDTPTGGIDAFDYDHDRGLTGRRRLVDVASPGQPDGLTVDEEGHLWIALWGGSAVHRYRTSGALDAVVELPVSQVTACAFGGAELDRLYVTTSRQGADLGAQPTAGALFAAVPGVRGLPPLPFSG